MASFSHDTINSPTIFLPHHSFSTKNIYQSQLYGHSLWNRSTRRRIDGRTKNKSMFVVEAIHSNPIMLTSKRRSRYGRPGRVISAYSDDDDDSVEGEDWLDDTLIYGDEFDVDQKSNKSQKLKDVGLSRTHNTGKRKAMKNTANGPLLDYLRTFGLKASHLILMYEKHTPSLQINVVSAQERLEYLLGIGVKQRAIKKILLEKPQILVDTVENNLHAHVAFLLGLGVESSKIGQIIGDAPSLLSYSVENSLKPTVKYLTEEVGIKENDLGKVVQRSPQILVQQIDNLWNPRYAFLSKELRAPRDSVVKMVTRHPQLLYYSIKDGLRPRINFLRSIGMPNSDIFIVLTRVTQVFSLSLEENLKPKFMYLINELQNEVLSLTKYPMYLSMSLDQRIRPRHMFLVSLKKVPKRQFPLSALVPSDECFCREWAGTSLDTYLAFRRRLLLVKDLAKKYERRQ